MNEPTRLRDAESLLLAFTQALRRGDRPDLAEFLPSEGGEAALAELVHAEMEHRARQGEAAPLEEYLLRFPQLRGEALVSLIQADRALRARGVESPPVAGRYRRLDLHARGGLGEVYRARDDELGRTVALKEIQPRFADEPALRARFLFEAEVTGALEHPGIVPVYGMGRHDGGRPYYAMRFVKGESLESAVARFHAEDGPGRGMALRGLLRRFIDVCNAVGFAHSRGVVHRDLKPANVMLGEYGETLVVDWGLAKQVGRDVAEVPPGEGVTGTDTPRTMAAGTADGAVVGTPAYMPPEQASAGEVVPASDVYALGATLYQVLTGRPPVVGETAREVLEKVRRGEVEPARRVNPRVPAALEAVCARAMATEPAGRYGTARELAEEVERWLADEPVRAYPEPLSARARRWAKRHRVLVTSGVVLLAATVVGLAGGLYAVGREQVRTAEQRDLAEAAEREARSNLLQSEANLTLAKRAVGECFGVAREHPLMRRADDDPSLRQLRRVLLEKALPFYQDFRVRSPDDPEALREVWEQNYRVGLIQDDLGDRRDALLRYREAEAVARRLAMERPGVPAHQEDLLRTLVALGNLLYNLGEWPEARRVLSEAVDRRRRDFQARPGEPGVRNALAGTLSNLGIVVQAQGDRQEALRVYTEAVEAQRPLAEGGNAEHQNDLGMVLSNKGIVEQALGLRQEAQASFTEAVRVGRLADRAGGVPPARNCLKTALINLGNMHMLFRRLDQALACAAEGVALARRVADRHPDIPKHRAHLAAMLNNLGSVQLNMKRTSEALGNLDEAVKIGRERASADATPESRDVLARSLANKGRLHHYLKQTATALKCYEEALALRRALTGTGQGGRTETLAEMAGTLEQLATLQGTTGMTLPALATYLEQVGCLRKLLDSPDGTDEHRSALAGALNNAGILQHTLGRFEEALKSYAASAEEYRRLMRGRRAGPETTLALMRPLVGGAALLKQRGRLAPAKEALDEAVGLLDELSKHTPKPPELDFHRLHAHRERAQVLGRLGRHREALPDWERALALTPAGSPERNQASQGRAYCLAQAGEYEGAMAEASGLAGAVDPILLARVLALSAGAAGRDIGRPLPWREKAVEVWSRQAVELLGRAAAAGYFRTPEQRKKLGEDKELDALRRRDDFRAFQKAL